MFKTSVIILVLIAACAALIGPAAGQEPLTEDLARLEYLLGEWQVDARYNRAAPDAADPDWEEVSGVAQFVPLMAGRAVLETFVASADGALYERTTFRGHRRRNQFAVATVDTQHNVLCTMLLAVRDDGSGSGNGVIGTECDDWQTTLEPISADEFRWTLAVEISRDADPVPVWISHYRRMGAGDSFDAVAAVLRDDYVAPPYPAGLDDFNFWLGEWDVVSFQDSVEDGFAAYDRVSRVSAGHAMIEIWTALEDTDRMFFTLTIWDEAREHFVNWYWHPVYNPVGRFYTGGTCEGTGAAKKCRLAGYFHHITADSIDWYFGAERAPGSQMLFTRAE